MLTKSNRKNFITIVIILALICVINILWSRELAIILNVKLFSPPHRITSISSTSSISSSSSSLSSSFSCFPKENIVFLKTHKCASSSIQRIFLKFGFLKGKLFLLPSKGNYIGHPKTFHRLMINNSTNYIRKWNIIAHHTRFNGHEMAAIMPQNTIFVTILRSPYKLYQSIIGYWQLNKVYHWSNLHSSQISSTKLFAKLGKHRFAGKIGLNQMLFDLGFNVNQLNSDKVGKILKYLESKFNLIMIADKFYESLILLSDLLCWPLDDVITFKVRIINFYCNLNASKKRFSCIYIT